MTLNLLKAELLLESQISNRSEAVTPLSSIALQTAAPVT